MTKAAHATNHAEPSAPSHALAAVPAASVGQQPDAALPSVIHFMVSWDGSLTNPPVVLTNQLQLLNNVLPIPAGYSGSISWTIPDGTPLSFVPGVMFVNSLPPTTPWPANIPLPNTLSVTLPWNNNLPPGALPQFFNYSITVVVTSGAHLGQIFTIDPTVENDPPTT